MKKLDAIRNRELWPLTPGEQARVAALATRAGIKVGRGKSPATADARMDAVFREAERRVEAEEKAAEKKAQEKADAKASRKRWF
jgi:hypothetical protein